MQGLLKVNFHGIDHGCSILAASKTASLVGYLQMIVLPSAIDSKNSLAVL